MQANLKKELAQICGHMLLHSIMRAVLVAMPVTDLLCLEYMIHITSIIVSRWQQQHQPDVVPWGKVQMV